MWRNLVPIAFLPFFLVGAGIVMSAQTADADDEPTVASLTGRKNFLINYVDLYVHNLTQNYGLSEDQAKKTRRILEQEDWKTHFQAAGHLEAFDRKMRRSLVNGREPAIQDIQAAAEKLYPVCRKTFKTMMLRTMRFHRILDDRQKAIHQKEIEELETNTAELTNRLDRWRVGDIAPGELDECFGGGLDSAPASQPANEEAGKKYSPTALDFWELYVRTFIEAFDLEPGQQTLAWSVFNEMKTKANAYRADHARQFAELTARTQARLARQNKTDFDEYRRQLEKLHRPLLEMFDELKLRLMKIPSEDQRQHALQILENPKEPPGQKKKSTQ